MKAAELCTGEWWDIQNLNIPQRSSLYNLEPIGIGTPQVESLTGCIQRLAYEHCLSTWMLVSRKIAPSISKEYLSENSEQNLSAFFSKGNMLNGTGSIAQDWAQAVEGLTRRYDLKFLTLLSFVEIIPLRNSFRKIRSWCSCCYADWLLARQQPYAPLLCTLDGITICVNHERLLDSKCHRCNQELPLLPRQHALDYCSKCGEWLGIKHTKDSCDTNLSEDLLKQQNCIAQNLGELFAVAPTLKIVPKAETIAENLTQLAEHTTSGNIKKFARELQITGGVVERACSGKRTPSLSNLLEICYQLNISPLNLVISTANIINTVDYNSPFFQRRKEKEEIKVVTDNSHCRKKNLDQRKIKVYLQSLLDDDAPPPPISTITKELGCNSKTLQYHAPDLCKQIVQ